MLIYRNQNKIRNQRLSDQLELILVQAAQVAQLDEVHVISGGQPQAPGSPRTGSTRHDNGNAADICLVLEGRYLSFEVPMEREFFVAFLRHVAELGCTGFGAGLGYMGPLTVHVGFGKPAIWGPKGQSAPRWLYELLVPILFPRVRPLGNKEDFGVFTDHGPNIDASLYISEEDEEEEVHP